MKLVDKRILVTGGAGFIGSNLVDALIALGNTVIVLDDFSTGRRENLADALASGRVEVVEGSILDQALVNDLLPRVDVVFHLAVQCLRVCFDQPHRVHAVNTTGTLNLLEAAHRLNPRLERFVYVSSSEIYGTAISAPMGEDHPLAPTTVYGASKLAGELYTRAYQTTHGLPTLILRPFNTYGFREHHEGASGEVIPRFVVNIANGKPPIIFGDGSQTRDFTFVTDTVTGLIRAAEADALVGEAVNIAYGREFSIKQIAQLLLEILGRQDLPLEGHPERPGDVRRHFADVTRLQQATGFKPSIPLEQGLKLYVDWFRNEYPDPARLLAECQTHNWKLDESLNPNRRAPDELAASR